MSEADLMRAVTDLAELLGWSWAHFRPAQTSKGWRTPVSGPLGKGWPDLVLIRERDKRLAFAELKAAGRQPTMEQGWVLQVLSQLDWHRWQTPGIGWVLPRVECHLWHPDDLDHVIPAVLR